MPIRQGAQTSLIELNDMAAAQYGNHPVNLLRREVAAWRQASYGEDRGRGWLLLTGELCLDALRANFILT